MPERIEKGSDLGGTFEGKTTEIDKKTETKRIFKRQEGHLPPPPRSGWCIFLSVHYLMYILDGLLAPWPLSVGTFPLLCGMLISTRGPKLASHGV